MSTTTLSPTGTLLRLATAGSVDDGKSTLVGRLLHDSKAILADQLEAVERVSRDRGLTDVDLALLTDGLRAEREQGITIDVAYRYFATDRRSFVLADCPGHVQYTRNTVTGASTADVVVLLVDARKGALEQTRRHLAVAALLRVPHVIRRSTRLTSSRMRRPPSPTWRQRLTRSPSGSAGGPARDPVSALHGDNIVDRSERTPWYAGPALLELLETLPSADSAEGDLRLPVQGVIRPQGAVLPGADPDFRGYAGRIDSGSLNVGDVVAVLPSGRRSTVRRIWLGDRSLGSAVAGQSVTVELADDIDISRGDVLAGPGSDEARRVFAATLCWLGDRPLLPGARVLVKHGSRTVPAMVRAITGRLDLDTLTHESADALALNDIGTVEVLAADALPVQPYETSRQAGAFLVLDPTDGNTLAAGLVEG